MVKILYSLALIGTLVVLADATGSREEYCRLESCQYKGQHTMCRYRALELNRGNCGTVNSSTLRPIEKTRILNLHNRLRRKVARGEETRGSNGPQPAATNLRNLRWNDELADIAQTWADQCNYRHDDCSDSIDPRIRDVGQNIIQWPEYGSHKFTLTGLIKKWYDEVDFFNKDNIASSRLEAKTGHYTQMVWAKTTDVGCGAVRYKDGRGLFQTYIVCNYGPAGNFDGEPIYLTA